MNEGAATLTFRVTVRYSAPRQRYETFELEAASVGEALRRAAERIAEGAGASADLVEVRRSNPAD